MAKKQRPSTEKAANKKNPLDNLRPPFPKGVSGNPRGRKKGLKESMRAKVKRQLANEPPAQVWARLIARGFDPNVARGDAADALALTLQALGFSGDLKAIQMLIDLVEPRRLELSTPEISPEERKNREAFRAAMRDPRAREALQTLADLSYNFGVDK